MFLHFSVIYNIIAFLRIFRFRTKPFGIMSQLATAPLMFLLFGVPIWTQDECNMKVLKLEEELRKVDDQAQAVEHNRHDIADLKSILRSLNTTVQEQQKSMLQYQEKSEALNSDISGLQAELNLIQKGEFKHQGNKVREQI